MSPEAVPAKRVSRALDRIDWDFADENPSAPKMRLNGVHWYPATFVAPLIGTMLDILAPEGPARVLDPFCGSGTAPLEAWYRGHCALGTDSNAFAISLSRARVRLVRGGTAPLGRRLASEFETWAGTNQGNRDDLPQAIGIANEASHWFVPEALRDIALTKAWVENEAPERWRSVLRVLLSSLLKRCSKVRDYHYTYIVDRSKVKSPALGDPDFSRLFAERLETIFRAGANMRAALREQGTINLDSPPSFRRAAAGDLRHIEAGEIDLILTSPPYFGMNDYVRSQYLTSLVFPSPAYQRDVDLESGSRRKRTSGPALTQYLADMRAGFAECERVLHPDGLIAIFLGHSQSRLARESNVVGQLAQELAELGFEEIWKGERRIRFRKITSTPSSSEYVWILRRS